MSDGVYVENAGQRFRVQVLADFIKFRDFAMSENDWKDHYEMPGLKVQSRIDSETKLTVFRVRRDMPTVKPEVLYNNFHDADYRKTWDANMLAGYNICVLNKHNDIGYYAVKFPWPLANRDFCNMRAWMEFTNGEYVIFNHTVPHADCPPQKNFVRAFSHLTGYYVRPFGNGGSQLVYVTHSDMCGAIPKRLVDATLNQKVPEVMTNIETCATKYVEWSQKEYPAGHVHAWTTPKMDWNNTSKHYPGEETKEAEKLAMSSITGTPGVPVGAEGASAFSGEPNADQAARIKQLEEELTNIKKRAMLDLSGGVDGNSIVRSGGGAISIAPVSPADPTDAPSVQRYRALMNDATNSVDRLFIQEGRVPTLREYMERLHFVLEGVRRTLPAE